MNFLGEFRRMLPISYGNCQKWLKKCPDAFKTLEIYPIYPQAYFASSEIVALSAKALPYEELLHVAVEFHTSS